MAIVTITGEVATNGLTGKKPAIPLHYDYTAPVVPWRTEFLHQTIGQDCKIIGSLWDYDLSADPAHSIKPIGHYLIENKAGERFVICVNTVNGERALALAAPFYDDLQEQGYAIASAKTWEDGRYVKEAIFGDKGDTNVYVHQERYVPQDWVMTAGITGEAGTLGQILGSMYSAGMRYASSPWRANEISAYSDATTMKFWAEGQKILEAYSTSGILSEAQNTAVGIVLPAIQKHGDESFVRELLDTLQNDRMPCHFNMIEKMVWKTPEGGLSIGGTETFARGYVPKMTQNATYDLGTAVARIILNPANHRAVYALSVNDHIFSELEELVESYNAQTGLSLTAQEALTAAKRSIMLLVGNALGMASLSPSSINAVINHIEHTLKNIAKVSQFQEDYPRWQASVRPAEVSLDWYMDLGL